MPGLGTLGGKAPSVGVQVAGVGGAQPFAPPSVSGTLTNSGDTVTLPISGGQWATAKFAVTATGTSAFGPEVSIDGGINYFASAYAKRLDLVSANPVVQASIANFGGGSSGTWEVPLPGNATHIRLRCYGTGTTTSVTLSGGALYVPGVPVVAVLYDVTSGTNASNNTGTLDTSGWSKLVITGSKSGTTASQNLSVQHIDDAGNPIDAGGIFALGLGAGANVAAYAIFGEGVGATVSPGGTTGGLTPLGPVWKRTAAIINPVATEASRIRIEARR